MKNIKQKLSIVMLIAGFAGLKAQQAFTATNGNISSKGGSISYSIGQTFYTVYNGKNGSISQGMQHSYEISIVSGIETSKCIAPGLVVYPNPSSDFLILNLTNLTKDHNQSLHYQIYNSNGNHLKSKNIENDQTSIDMSNLEPAIYFLKIMKDAIEVKTFRIIKK